MVSRPRHFFGIGAAFGCWRARCVSKLLNEGEGPFPGAYGILPWVMGSIWSKTAMSWGSVLQGAPPSGLHPAQTPTGPTSCCFIHQFLGLLWLLWACQSGLPVSCSSALPSAARKPRGVMLHSPRGAHSTPVPFWKTPCLQPGAHSSHWVPVWVLVINSGLLRVAALQVGQALSRRPFARPDETR